MKEKIQHLWDGLDEKTKNRLATVCVGVMIGIFGSVVLDTEIATDRELDALCGDNRSGCQQVQDMNRTECGSGPMGYCSHPNIWVTTTPVPIERK